MHAIRVHKFGEPEVMRIEELPDPKPGLGEVVVEIRAAGVNPVDTYIRSGAYRQDLPLPYTPGIDGAGIITAIGPGVKHRNEGDRVYVAWCLTGTYAGKVLCREFQTHPLAESVTFSQGAAIGVPYGAAFRALFQRAMAKADEVVLVHGASGGVGIAAVQLARGAGMRVIGTAGSDMGIELVLAQGAHHVLNHREPGYLQALEGLTCGNGVDVVLEMLANVNLGNDLTVLAKGGRVVVIGSRGPVEIDPRKTMLPETAILGMSLYSASDRDLSSMHAALGAGLENGTLRPVVSMEMPLADAAKSHHAVMEASTLGKIVLIP
jgi:NADPH2:quinone reductase